MRFLWVLIFLAIVSLVALLEMQEFNIHCLLGLLSTYASLIVQASFLVICPVPMSIFVLLGIVLLWTAALKTPSLSNRASMALQLSIVPLQALIYITLVS